MSKVIYFDCFSGASGDMILSSLLDLGIDISFLKKQLSTLKLDAFEIDIEEIKKSSIMAKKLLIKTKGPEVQRNLSEILKIIENSEIDNKAKQISKQIFSKLGKIESNLHGIDIQDVHFHEIGAIDSIIDIVGSAICIVSLSPEYIYSSPLPFCKGYINMEHGLMPNPAPATVECLKGIPTFSVDIDKELLTPTGAAILSIIVDEYRYPSMIIQNIGYGAGSMELETPNILRTLIGEINKVSNLKNEIIETNIDDMNPELYDFIFKELYEIGALEVYLTPVIMKKNRPGILLSILFEPNLRNSVLEFIFENTTSIGFRLTSVEKFELDREQRVFQTSLGEIRAKASFFNDKLKSLKPEYSDCKKLSIKHKMSIIEVYRIIEKELFAQLLDE